VEIKGCDVQFAYTGTYEEFVKDVLWVCLQHWPHMVVEFNHDNTFYVHDDRHSYFLWEGDRTPTKDKSQAQLLTIVFDSGTMVVDEDWKNKSAAKIVEQVKSLWPCPPNPDQLSSTDTEGGASWEA
jgi:hypothetical protein